MLFRRLDHPHPLRNVRLDTLVRLRWLAIGGQFAAVLFVNYVLDFDLPLEACLAVISLSAWLNVALRLRYRITRRLEPSRAAWLFAYDIAQLAILLYLTGGLQNPFAFLVIGPVLVAATALPRRSTVILGGFAMICATTLVFVHHPLPWADNDTLTFPPLYLLGIWLSILLAIFYIGIYAWLVSEEARQLSDALTSTELVLAREQHISQLDGLAAAAAHELGTPLATISLVSRELERAIEADSPLKDDVRLLREQAQRCRDILAKLTQLSSLQEPFHRVTISAVVETVAAPHQNFGIAIDIVMPEDRSDEPVLAQNPAILYGLGNLVENAVDFAKTRVEIAVRWSRDDVVVTISDDGPGFAPDIITRIGEPYVTSRGGKAASPDFDGTKSEEKGLGLGFFIARTLLERSGARLAYANRPDPLTGAVVRVVWPRADLERE